MSVAEADTRDSDMYIVKEALTTVTTLNSGNAAMEAALERTAL